MLKFPDFMEINEQRKTDGLSHAVKDGLRWVFKYPREYAPGTCKHDMQGRWRSSQGRFSTLREAYLACCPECEAVRDYKATVRQVVTA